MHLTETILHPHVSPARAVGDRHQWATATFCSLFDVPFASIFFFLMIGHFFWA
jgi:hypothetical protein